MIFSTKKEIFELLPAKFAEGQILEDGRTVSAYRVFNECALVLILKSEVYQLFAADIRNVSAKTDLHTKNEFQAESITVAEVKEALYSSEWFIERSFMRKELNKAIAKQKREEKKVKKVLAS